jgi:hypothetical protein
MYTEFISSEGLIRNAQKSVQKLDIFDYERPIGIQIFGGDIESMRMAAEIVEEAKPDILDINYGCPGGGCEPAAPEARAAHQGRPADRRAVCVVRHVEGTQRARMDAASPARHADRHDRVAAGRREGRFRPRVRRAAALAGC